MSNTRLIQRIRNPPQPPLHVLVYSKLAVCVIPIAEIAIGAVYLHDCPRQYLIPIYLIVMGVFGLSMTVFYCLPCAGERDDGTFSPLRCVCLTWNLIASMFAFCWFIAGNVWIYSIYKPNYDKSGAEPYCDKTLYLFAFWITTLAYILLAGILVLSCCVLFCLYLCGQADPDDDV